MKKYVLLIFLSILIYLCSPKPTYAYQTIPSYTNQTTSEVIETASTLPQKNNSHSIQSLQWMFNLFIFLLIALSIILIFSSFF